MMEGGPERGPVNTTGPPAPPLGLEEMAKVVVANVYSGGATVKLDLPASTTIGGLKSRLSESFAERPSPKEQRLIYCGKICDEDETLRDVLRDLSSPQTFHLVLCKERRPSPPQREEPPAAPPVVDEIPPLVDDDEEEDDDFDEMYEEALRNGGWNTTQPRFSTRLLAVVRRTAAHPIIAAFDFKLLAKLVAVVALLGHEGTRSRIAMLSFMAALAFLLQTGIARIALATILPTRPLARPSSGALTNAAFGRVVSLDAQPHSLSYDVPLFILSFFLSLAPAWRPVVSHRVPPHRD